MLGYSEAVPAPDSKISSQKYCSLVPGVRAGALRTIPGEPRARARGIVSGDVLWNSSSSPPKDKEDHAHHQEYKEQQFRDPRRSRGNPTKPKYRCNQSDY
jgi:hypothetical protein